MTKGTEIVADFVSALRNRPGIKTVEPCGSISRNVFEVNGSACWLLYLKGRGEEPYRWGVTDNVIKRLKQQSQNWFVVLLYESQNTGYLLPFKDVINYIQKNIWPLGNDGDYKPAAPGNYLSQNTPFKTSDEFFRLLRA